jgi:hypothetical protein
MHNTHFKTHYYVLFVVNKFIDDAFVLFDINV